MEVWTDVEWLVEAAADPAEGPVWDADRGVLWWVDIGSCAVHRYDPLTGEDTVLHTGEPVGSVALRANGSLLVHLASGVSFLDPSTGALYTFVSIEADNDATRANDGKPGPDGCYWGGTMAKNASRGQGAFYRVTPGGDVQTVLTDVSISNGLDWISDERLYFIDSLEYGIDILAVDVASGVPRERVRFVDISEADGLPDGMTLDAEGFLWVALYGGGVIRRYDPSGELVGRVVVPAAKTTSCAFGGSALTDLYITAAADEGGKGGLLRCRVDVAGRAPFVFDG